MKSKLHGALSLFLAFLMLFMMIPFTAVSADDAVVDAEAVVLDETSTETTTEETPAQGEESDTVTYPIVFDKDQITLGSFNLRTPAITYSDATGVTTLTMTADVTDADTVYYTVSGLDSIYPKNTPYIVLGVGSSAAGSRDISIGYKNAYVEAVDTTYETWRAYGKSFTVSDTITNVVIDATAYTSGDKSYTDADGNSIKLNYNNAVSADTTFDYLRIRLANGGTITAGTTVDVRFIAFFDNLEDAQNYVYPVDTATVTYAVDGEAFGDTQTYDVGDRLVYIDDVPAKDGYDFLGWDVDEGTLVAGDLTINALFEDANIEPAESYILVDANELYLATGRGEVIAEKETDYVPVLRLTSAQSNKNSATKFFFSNTTLGIPDTGSDSLYHYSHYVIRYKTSGEARTSDTVNLRGCPADTPETEYEKYGGTDQIVKSDDEYVIKTIVRDTYKNGTVTGVLAEKTWTGQYMTLKLFESSSVEGYIDIDFIALCKDEQTAADFITAYENGEIVRDYPAPEIPTLNTKYNLQNQTLSTTLMSDSSTFFSADTLYYSDFVDYTGDMTVTLEHESDGEAYVNLSIPAGTYSNNQAYFSIAAEELAFNVVDYRYMKFVYEADYDKTMDISVNPYTNSAFSGETYIKGASNPTASAGVEKEYVLDLTKLGAKTEITSDYSKFNLICKVLGSQSKTIDTEANLKIKYIGFFQTETDALNFVPGSSANATFEGYDMDALADDILANETEYFEAYIPVDSTTTGASITLTAELLETLAETAPVKFFNIDCGTAKITLDENALYSLFFLGSDITLELEYFEDGAYISLTDGTDDIMLGDEVRVLLNITTGDKFVVAAVDGDIAPTSGVIKGLPAVRTTLPASVSYDVGLYTEFEDAEAVLWAADNIKFMTARGLFKGISSFEFAPNGKITRAMAATLFERMAGNDEIYTDITCTDVDADAWYANSVEWAVTNGIADVTGGKFRPDEPITREELALFIYNYSEYKMLPFSTGEAIEFTDADDITYTVAVDFCSSNGIINGYDDGSFNPDGLATRAEAATLFARFIKASLLGNEIDTLDYQNISFDEDNIVLTFVAMSDIHIERASETSGPAVNYINAMNTAYDLSTTGDIDLVFAAGDLAQNLYTDPTSDSNADNVIDQDDQAKLYEIDAYKSLTDTVLRDDTYLVFTTGNHDRSNSLSYESYFYDAFTATEEDVDRYYRYDVTEDCDYEKGNRHAVINGYHFLSVGMYQDYTAYLKPILDELTADDPFKPVFVQYHFHATDTVYSTHYSTSTAQRNLRTLLDNYPQVVFFSGHTHNGLDNPRAIWQGTFTALDTASVRYLDDNSLIHGPKKIPINATHGEVFDYASEATLVEVDANNHIRFRPFNGYRGDIVNEFIISAPDEFNTHLLTYTQEREIYSPAPVFDEDTEFTLTKTDADRIEVYFDQATHEDIVWYYSIEFEAEGETAQKFYFTSRYYDPSGMPDAIDCTLYSDSYYVSKGDNHAGLGHELTEGVTYTATLTAYDVWDHPSESITIDYTA